MLQVARKIDHVYPEGKYLKYENRAHARKESINNDAQSLPISKTKAVLAVAVCFMVCFIILYRYSVITEFTYRINRYNRELNELKLSNDRLRMQTEQGIDLINIERMAKDRLGLQRPDQYQIVYVMVPRRDSTQAVADVDIDKLYRQEIIANSKTAFLGSIGEKFGRLVRFLY